MLQHQILFFLTHPHNPKSTLISLYTRIKGVGFGWKLLNFTFAPVLLCRLLKSLCSQQVAASYALKNLWLIILQTFLWELSMIYEKNSRVESFRPRYITSRVLISEDSCQAGTHTPFPALPTNFERAAPTHCHGLRRRDSLLGSNTRECRFWGDKVSRVPKQTVAWHVVVIELQYKFKVTKRCSLVIMKRTRMFILEN